MTRIRMVLGIAGAVVTGTTSALYVALRDRTGWPR